MNKVKVIDVKILLRKKRERKSMKNQYIKHVNKLYLETNDEN
jgi:hypothetical protein